MRIAVALCFAASACAASHAFTQMDRNRVQTMLRGVSTDVKEHYYDVHFHGVDWDAQVARAQEQIGRAPSLNMAMSYVAAAVDSLNDSHTIFSPPERPYRFDHGFRSQMIGDLAGEELQLDVFAQAVQTGRADFWDEIRDLENESHLMRTEFGVVEGDIEVVKLRRFAFDHSDLETVVAKARAHKAMIMTDGKSLEHTGVVPDELINPTAADLLEGRDPVLAHAIETLGGSEPARGRQDVPLRVAEAVK